MGGDRRADDQGDVDADLPPRPGSVVVLRAVGTLRRAAQRPLSHRRGGHAVILDDRYLLVRAAAVDIAARSTVAVWAGRRPFDGAEGRPGAREVAGASLGALWNVPALLALHLAAIHIGWWHYEARGGLFLGMPVDLLLVWVWLWGAVPAIACGSWPLGLVLLSAFAGDLAFMPAAAPVVRLGPSWILGDAVGVLTALLPAVLLARWTARDERLVARAILQMIAFAGLLLFVLPAIAIDATGTTWVKPVRRPVWQLSLIAQLLAVPALVGLTAVQEFV